MFLVIYYIVLTSGLLDTINSADNGHLMLYISCFSEIRPTLINVSKRSIVQAFELSLIIIPEHPEHTHEPLLMMSPAFSTLCAADLQSDAHRRVRRQRTGQPCRDVLLLVATLPSAARGGGTRVELSLELSRIARREYLYN